MYVCMQTFGVYGFVKHGGMGCDQRGRGCWVLWAIYMETVIVLWYCFPQRREDEGLGVGCLHPKSCVMYTCMDVSIVYSIVKHGGG